MQGAANTDVDIIERKRYFARKNFELNEKAYRRYMTEVSGGMPADEARALVKDAFNIGDRRLDNILDSRAGHITPGTAAKMEALMWRYVERTDLDVSALRRHIDQQLESCDKAEASGEENFTVKLVEFAGGKKGRSFKIEKIPIAEAKRVLLEYRAKYNQMLFDALKALRVDTLIQINTGPDISQYTPDELEKMYKAARGLYKVPVSEGAVEGGAD